MAKRFAAVLLAVALLGCAGTASDVILPPLSSAVGPDVALFIIQGAEIAAEAYTPLANAIQQASSSTLRLWVGIPDFPLSVPEPLLFGDCVNRVYASLVGYGMSPNAPRFAGAHSLGGVMTQDFIAGNKSAFQAQILMGAFIQASYNQSFTTPTLTIGGELDGLCRLLRIGEAYLLQMQQNSPSRNPPLNFPVVVVYGMSHMQFASGTPPALVKASDLIPEITYAAAHAAVGQLVTAFVQSQLEQSVSQTITNALAASMPLFQPILDSYTLEGNNNIVPPCNCDLKPNNSLNINYYPCPPQPGCLTGSPWGEYIQQQMGGLPQVQFNVTSAFHPVEQTTPTNLPFIFENCSAPTSDCLLTITTVNQNKYNFDPLDTGYGPQAATEIRAKMMSRQSIWIHAGIPNANFNETDGPNLCAEMNQLSLDWALQHAPAASVARYNAKGQPMVFGPDIEEIGGPWWIWTPLQRNSTGGKMVVTSPAAKFPDPYWISFSCCFHYCKLLSPASALEWVLYDSLRLNNSLAG